MSISTSRLSYTDCFEFFDKAIEDSKGARIILGSYADANFFRMRCHQARKIDRQDNLKIHDVGTKLHGASLYDQVSLRIKEDSEGQFYVYAEKTELDLGDVEGLSELEE